ncbi:MAG TPA: hypothetical protein VKY85_14895 [Candidatus Angelobacter sp.]|nr:hypothetical protein [Candidatus Angelobacter sp.]
MIFKTGDMVRITYEGATVNGEIFLACSTGLSLTVSFNGRLGNYTGLMPLFWLEDRYIDVVNAKTVTITPMGRILPWPVSPARAANSK